MRAKIKLGELPATDIANYSPCYTVTLRMFESYIEGKRNYKISPTSKVIKQLCPFTGPSALTLTMNPRSCGFNRLIVPGALTSSLWQSKYDEYGFHKACIEILSYKRYFFYLWEFMSMTSYLSLAHSQNVQKSDINRKNENHFCYWGWYILGQSF